MNLGDLVVGCALVILSALAGKAVVERDRAALEKKLNNKFSEPVK